VAAVEQGCPHGQHLHHVPLRDRGGDHHDPHPLLGPGEGDPEQTTLVWAEQMDATVELQQVQSRRPRTSRRREALTWTPAGCLESSSMTRSS